MLGISSGKEKAHKHKQSFPVTAPGGGGLPAGWPGVSRPVARGQKFMFCVRNPRNLSIFVRVPGRGGSGTRPGGSGEKKTNKHEQLRGIVLEMGGGQIVYVFPFFLGKKGNT